MSRPRRRVLAALAAVALLTACTGADDGEQVVEADAAQEAPRIIQPGAPGEPSRELTPEEAAAIEMPEHTDADVRFMQMMIPHHAQALEMTALVPDRTSREDIPLFAERMEISQEDEIEFMQRWLDERGEEVPDLGEGHAHGDHSDHGDHGDLMPGMLTEEQMAELEAATGEEFDRLFLTYMHQHHVGALEMVEELFTSEGAGAEPEIFQFANHIDSDQRIELSRIESMLAEMAGNG
jgi:uncharacterized protein (DUF305 family)